MFRLRSRDGIGQGVRHMLRLAMKATERDRMTMRLPAALAPLYVFARPWRLLREYGFGLGRKIDLDLAIYDPTPQEMVSRILQLASVGPGDVLYDLGCGDGRIVIAAAKKYGIRAVGVEMNPRLIAEARANARREGVEPLVQFLEQDAKTTRISEATVVTMYLSADGNLRLVERLRSELRPGARIVSRKFQIYGWTPEKVEQDVAPDGSRTALYLWRIEEPRGIVASGSAANDSMAELKGAG
jgi:SAM-dependent methyltransferase